MTRHERVRLFALAAPAVVSFLLVTSLAAPSWAIGRPPLLRPLIEAFLFYWACMQVALWIWYVRIRNSL